MDVTDRDPSLVPVPVPALERLQDDEVQGTDIQLVIHSVEGRMVVEVRQGVTFTDQAALALAHVLVHPFDVVLQTDLHRPEGVPQVILEEDMVVADLEATPFVPAAPAHDPSLIHVHARCHIQASPDILEAAAVPDQLAGEGEAAVVMISETVDPDHPKLDDMAYLFDVYLSHCSS